MREERCHLSRNVDRWFGQMRKLGIHFFLTTDSKCEHKSVFVCSVEKYLYEFGNFRYKKCKLFELATKKFVSENFSTYKGISELSFKTKNLREIEYLF